MPVPIILCPGPARPNGDNRNLTLGLRNLKGVTLMATREVNPYHLLGHKTVFLSEAAARKFSEALAK